MPVQQGMYPYGHTNEGVAAVFECLQTWFDAMEDGSTDILLPDPDYQRPAGKAPWTEEDLERLISGLDYEIEQEVKRAPGTQFNCTAGPEFHRLALPQRIALAQQLETILTAHAEVLKTLPGYL